MSKQDFNLDDGLSDYKESDEGKEEVFDDFGGEFKGGGEDKEGHNHSDGDDEDNLE